VSLKFSEDIYPLGLTLCIELTFSGIGFTFILPSPRGASFLFKAERHKQGGVLSPPKQKRLNSAPTSSKVGPTFIRETTEPVIDLHAVIKQA
jgi:hypothetical protein